MNALSKKTQQNFPSRIKKRDPSVVKKVVIQVLDEDDDSDFVYEEVRKKNKSKKVDENNEATTSFEQTENLEITKKKKTEDFQYGILLCALLRQILNILYNFLFKMENIRLLL